MQSCLHVGHRLLKRSETQAITRMNPNHPQTRRIRQPRVLCAVFLVLALAVSCSLAQTAAPSGTQVEHACPPSSTDAGTLIAEQNILWLGASGSARACWVGGNGQANDRVVLELQIEGLPLVRQQLPANEEIEGQLDELRFDNTPFVLSDTGLTLALRLAARNRGTLFDDSFVYLWLYQFDGHALKRVFDMATDEIHGTRSCDKTCRPPSRSHSILIVQAGSGHQGLRDLRQRQKTWMESPNGKPRTGTPAWRDQLHIFDGNKYQTQN
jgi:hypothetical protein